MCYYVEAATFSEFYLKVPIYLKPYLRARKVFRDYLVKPCTQRKSPLLKRELFDLIVQHTPTDHLYGPVLVLVK